MSEFIELKWKKGKIKIYLLGCMMVPEFYHKDKIISPLHTCQWPDKDPKKFSQLPGILRNLRGDLYLTSQNLQCGLVYYVQGIL